MKKIIMILVIINGLLLANDEVMKASPDNTDIKIALNPPGISVYKNNVVIDLNSKAFDNTTIKTLREIVSAYSNEVDIDLINLEIGNTVFSNTGVNYHQESFSKYAHKVVYENDSKDKRFLDSILKNVKDEDERAEILKHLIIYSLLLIILGALGMVLFLKISEEISEKMKNEGYSIYHYLLRYGLRFILLCIVVYIVFIFINETSTYLAK